MNKSISRNPFVKAGTPPATRTSVVAFLDILGFQEQMTAAYKRGEEAQLLRTLRAALDDAGHHLTLTSGSSDPVDFSRVKTFTDNVVLGFPISGDGELDIGLVLSMVGLYQLTMVKYGFFVRGAIACGELYMDEDIVFGDGLIDAYKAEAQIARDPRVILTSSAVTLVKSHVRYYATLEHSPQYQELLIDSDGEIFVNYLDSAFDESDRSPHPDTLSAHQRSVELRLQQFTGNPVVWNKYAWVARYHNWICEEFGPELARFRIGRSSLQPSPRRLDWSTGNVPFDIN